MSDVLARICDAKRADVAARKAHRSLEEIEAFAEGADLPRGFQIALRRRAAAGDTALICEIKKASPSAGVLRADFDPAALARAYYQAGAACLSVLTDEPFFQGRDTHMAAARGACPLPILRKDFILDPWQVVESRALGADCVLLIMAALDDALAATLMETARDWGMDVLVEVHDAPELARALKLNPDLIGINSRNLKTLVTDLSVFESLAPLVPAGKLLVAESGVESRSDIDRLSRAGAQAFLVGTSLMRQPDLLGATAALMRPLRGAATG